MAKKSNPSHELENYRHPDKFGEWLGYKLDSIDPEKHIAEVTLEVRGDHLSPARRVHGGAISAFFDFAFGTACFSTLGPKDFCSTVELKVNYLRPLELGDRLRARAEVIFRGKRLCVMRGLLYRNDSREPAAMATATFNIVSAKA